MYFNNYNIHEFAYLILLNITLCTWCIFKSIRNNELLCSLVQNKFTSNKLGIFEGYGAIIRSKELILSNWILIKKDLSRKWNLRIHTLLFMMLLNPALFSYMHIDHFYNFIGIEMFVFISFLFTAYKSRKFFETFENYLESGKSNKEYSKEEIQSLIVKLDHSQQLLEDSHKTNQMLKNAIEELSTNIVDVAKITYISKDLLKNLTNHIINHEKS